MDQQGHIILLGAASSKANDIFQDGFRHSLDIRFRVAAQAIDQSVFVVRVPVTILRFHEAIRVQDNRFARVERDVSGIVLATTEKPDWQRCRLDPLRCALLENQWWAMTGVADLGPPLPWHGRLPESRSVWQECSHRKAG
jgi:hypothetical protein